MANACFWLATSQSAEFHGLNVFLCHLLGRGRETSTLKPEDIGVIDTNDNLHDYQLLCTTIQRDKEGALQELNLCPDKTSIQRDPHFSLLHCLLVCGFHSSLFPKFFKEACVIDRQKKNKARVSAFWEQCFDGMKKEFISLKELMEDKKYTSYHVRKASNQKLAETTSVSGIAQYFRTGSQSRAVNTVFDYVVGTQTLTNQAGKALGG